MTEVTESPVPQTRTPWASRLFKSHNRLLVIIMTALGFLSAAVLFASPILRDIKEWSPEDPSCGALNEEPRDFAAEVDPDVFTPESHPEYFAALNRDTKDCGDLRSTRASALGGLLLLSVGVPLVAWRRRWMWPTRATVALVCVIALLSAYLVAAGFSNQWGHMPCWMPKPYRAGYESGTRRIDPSGSIDNERVTINRAACKNGRWNATYRPETDDYLR